jgi:L-arabinonolactonase
MEIGKATPALELRHDHGESIRWYQDQQVAFWTDVENNRLWRQEPEAGALSNWTMPEPLSCFALCRDRRFALLGLASQLAFFEFSTGRIETIERIEARLNTRINDGRCDRQGRFVFGTQAMGNPGRPEGACYRLNLDLTVERLPLPRVMVANSLAFSEDGGTFYFCDSPTRRIYRCRYYPNGRIEKPRLFVQLAPSEGQPDGSTVDADGGLWNAQWGGACVVRYDAGGRQTARIDVAADQVSCVAIGGPSRRLLYITTARQINREASNRQPEAGAIFQYESRHCGVPEARFGTAPWRPHLTLVR